MLSAAVEDSKSPHNCGGTERLESVDIRSRLRSWCVDLEPPQSSRCSPPFGSSFCQQNEMKTHFFSPSASVHKIDQIKIPLLKYGWWKLHRRLPTVCVPRGISVGVHVPWESAEFLDIVIIACKAHCLHFFPLLLLVSFHAHARSLCWWENKPWATVRLSRRGRERRVRKWLIYVDRSSNGGPFKHFNCTRESLPLSLPLISAGDGSYFLVCVLLTHTHRLTLGDLQASRGSRIIVNHTWYGACQGCC